MSGPEVKGWCPGALQPMQSGDGLIMRVRPRMGLLSNEQALGLCDVSMTFGNGVIDLTNRANLQLRGIKSHDHQAVLDELLVLDLLDETPELEARRNIICAPLRSTDGLAARLALELTERLAELPELPSKFGFAIDVDGPPQLSDAPADIRIETGPCGLIVRADGSPRGAAVTAGTAINELISFARWFTQTRDNDIRRMAPHLGSVPLPLRFARETSHKPAPQLVPGQLPQARVFGAPFGSLPTTELRALLSANSTSTLTLTHSRMFLLSGQLDAGETSFLTTPDAPELGVDACPGAPACSATKQNTRAIARALTPHLNGRSLHVSGCTKGCARPRNADVVLVGQKGGFDLVLNGVSWDVPVLQGIKPDSIIDAVINELGRH